MRGKRPRTGTRAEGHLKVALFRRCSPISIFVVLSSRGTTSVTNIGSMPISGGKFLTQWGSSGSATGQFNGLRSAEVDGAGNVYVADTFNDRIQKFDGSGNFLTSWGGFGDGAGQFSGPSDVAAGGVIGSSIGAGGSGAWIGLGLGMIVGVGLWQWLPSMEMPDAIGVGLIGMAVGGFTSWIIRAVDAGDSPPSDLPVLQFDVAVPW